MVCVDDYKLCVTPDQLTACNGLNGNDACTAGTITGVCNAAAAGMPCEHCICLAAHCGDGFVQAPEECDGTDLGAKPLCSQHDYYEDTNVDCNVKTCQYVLQGACSRTCGDGVVEPAHGESCDDTVAPIDPCVTFGYDAGRALCQLGGCSPDFSTCKRIGWTTAVADALRFDIGALAVAGGNAFVAGYTTANHVSLWQYDGISWSKTATGFDLLSVKTTWASSATDIYIGGVAPSGQSRVLHYNGTTWTSEDGGASAAMTITGTAANDVWILGLNASRHWDGSSWTNTGAIGSSITPRAAYAIAANDIYFYAQGGGGGQVWHWDGSAWTQITPLPLPSTSDLAGAQGHVVIAGAGGVYRRDGSTWTNLGFPLASAAHVWAVAPDDIYVDTLTNNAWHYDGASWTIIYEHSASNPAPAFSQLATIPGMVLGIVTSGSVLRYGGAAWEHRAASGTTPANAPYTSVVVDPNGRTFVAAAPGTVEVFPAMAGASSVTSTTPVAVVGRAGADVYVAGGGSGASIQKWTGSTWSTNELSGTTNPISAIAGPDASTVFATDDQNIWVRSSTGTWSTVTVANAPSLAAYRDLWCLEGGTRCVAVGTGNLGTIAMWNGSTWSAQSVAGAFTAVWGASANDIWAVGNGPVIAHFDGTSWSATAVPGLAGSITSVAGTASNDVFVGTDAGQLHHWDGSAWSPVRSDVTVPIVRDLYATGTQVWIVGGFLLGPPKLVGLDRTIKW